MSKPLPNLISKYKCTRPVDETEEHFNVANENKAIQELFEDGVCGKGHNGTDLLADHRKSSHSQLSN